MLEPFEYLRESAGANLGPARRGGDAAQEVEGTVLEGHALHDGARLFLVELGAVGVRAENCQAGAGIFKSHERVQAGRVRIRVDEADLLPLLCREGCEVEGDGASTGRAVGTPDGHDLAEAVARLVAGGCGGILVDVRMLRQGAVVVLVLHVQGVVATGRERVNDGGGLAKHGFFVAGSGRGCFRRIVCTGHNGCWGGGVDSVASVVGAVGCAGVCSSTRGGVVAVTSRLVPGRAVPAVIVAVATVGAVVAIACIIAVTSVLTVGGLRVVHRLCGSLIRGLRGNAVTDGGAGERRIHRLFERAQNLIEGSFGADAMRLRGQGQVVRGDNRQEHFGGGERVHGGGAHFGGHVRAEQHAGDAGVCHSDGFAEVLHGACHGNAAALGFDAVQERAVIAVEDDGDVHWPSP